MRRTIALPAAALAFVALGAGARLWPSLAHWSSAIWLVGLALTGLPLVWRTLRAAAGGHFATDLVATLSVIGALLLGQPLAGLIIVLMQSGGEALERYAEGKASEALRELENARPRLAHRVSGDTVVDIAAEDIVVGDTLLLRPGELVPCDAEVVDGRSHVDASRLTGEPMPVRAETGVPLMSGSVNQEGSLTLTATALSRDSQYARIVELVRSAQASKAPLQRLADRYAMWFTPFTLAVCGLVYLATGDAVRVLAVLVVATPCPLILAAPVAFIGGINRAARRQIIVRHGAALERLGIISTVVFDKTGTITIGRPRVSHVVAAPGTDEREVLRLAGAVEQRSSHLLARTLVEAADARGIRPPDALDVTEVAGRGVAGFVEGHQVIVGARSFVLETVDGIGRDFATMEPGGANEAGLQAYVAVDGRAAGIVTYADEIRPGLEPFFADLEQLGVHRTLLLSGDRIASVRAVAASVGIEDVEGDLLPAGKVATVMRLVRSGERVLMVGDGTNDAPAMSAATVGIALAHHGGGITAEAADVVILADDLTRVAEAIRIGQRTLRIARQSIWVGLGLSAAAMVVAAAGLIVPTTGALLQEGIDLAVILNALRARR